MTTKQQHVPGTHATKPNREQRRHPDGRPQDQPLARDEQAPQLDIPDVKAKDSGHGKKTTDK